MRLAGFANPEYLLTLAVLLVLATLSIPPFVKARQRSLAFKALGELRAASASYAAKTKAKGPLELSDLVKDGYLPELPPLVVPGLHPRSAVVTPLGQTDDKGGWTHANWPGGPREGEIWINCTHTDSRGALWSSY
ncbi:MAG: hypothetical protein HY553_17810 [Elusimicrobia bacterium]|nr:hypothetical protein [Elusimicrobiota bacterium]